MKREKTPRSTLGDQLRTFAAAYAVSGQRDRAEGLVQASHTADAHLAGSTTGIVDPIVEALIVAARAVVDAAQRVTEAADRITEAAADIASAGDLGDEPRRRAACASPCGRRTTSSRRRRRRARGLGRGQQTPPTSGASPRSRCTVSTRGKAA